MYNIIQYVKYTELINYIWNYFFINEKSKNQLGVKISNIIIIFFYLT